MSRTHKAAQSSSNLSVKLVPVHSIRLFYTQNAAILSWSFTARELHACSVVHNRTTGVSTTHHRTRDSWYTRM